MIKILHCADLHLDSPMNTRLTPHKAKERRHEILETFRNMVDFAEKNSCTAVLIAGDLFDRSVVSPAVLNTVKEQIRIHPDILFYYLRGNHDRDVFKSSSEDLPSNLMMFNENWTSYLIPDTDICIYGMELNGKNDSERLSELRTDSSKFNIVMLHGELSYGKADLPESLDAKTLENKNIDYLALGHIHRCTKGNLDSGAVWCYPGCLEGRGFDECGNHGFIEADISEKVTDSGRFTDTENMNKFRNNVFTLKFIPAARRRLFEIKTDVTGCGSSEEIIEKAGNIIKTQDIRRDDFVRIVLTGETDPEAETDTDFITSVFSTRYYYAEVCDETQMFIDPEIYKYDRSLRGEFIRQVKESSDISEGEKTEIIRCGMKALAGDL